MNQGAQLHREGGASLAQDSREAVRSPSLKISENRLGGAVADHSQHWGKSFSKQDDGQETGEGSCSQHFRDSVLSTDTPSNLNLQISVRERLP